MIAGLSAWRVVLLVFLNVGAEGFLIRRSVKIPLAPSPARASGDVDVGRESPMSIESYQHKSFKLTYLYKPPALGRERDCPVVLIHPVGVGLSSWFWKKMMQSFKDNPPIYAPDLIGCGIDHGADAWYPEKNGLFFPLSWAEGVETLINNIVLPRWRESRPTSMLGFLGNNQSNLDCAGCLVIAQGGLAPVGIMLARRNPFGVGKLMLTSPPTYSDITTAIPEPELQRNYNFLRSPLFGGLAFGILESREIIKFFSDLFLFEGKCDDQWLDEVMREVCVEARTPVQAFNAGLLQHRSFKEDLVVISQPIVVVSGEGDKRVSDRLLYQTELDKCTLKTIPGCSVLPWENPIGVIDLINEVF
ncbi:hypothetical protein ACHAWF_010601 [Thalassiosira exigua]